MYNEKKKKIERKKNCSIHSHAYETFSCGRCWLAIQPGSNWLTRWLMMMKTTKLKFYRIQLNRSTSQLYIIQHSFFVNSTSSFQAHSFFKAIFIQILCHSIWYGSLKIVRFIINFFLKLMFYQHLVNEVNHWSLSFFIVNLTL